MWVSSCLPWPGEQPLVVMGAAVESGLSRSALRQGAVLPFISQTPLHPSCCSQPCPPCTPARAHCPCFCLWPWGGHAASHHGPVTSQAEETDPGGLGRDRRAWGGVVQEEESQSCSLYQAFGCLEGQWWAPEGRPSHSSTSLQRSLAAWPRGGSRVRAWSRAIGGTPVQRAQPFGSHADR